MVRYRQASGKDAVRSVKDGQDVSAVEPRPAVAASAVAEGMATRRRSGLLRDGCGAAVGPVCHHGLLRAERTGLPAVPSADDGRAAALQLLQRGLLFASHSAAVRAG